MNAASSIPRACPICSGPAGVAAFPYMTRFNNVDYTYLKCASCATVFVEPIPDAPTFNLMYAKADYHDCHYEGVDQTAYTESVIFLSRYLLPGKRVLDYGCGAGYFLNACVSQGFLAVGVEFDEDEARAAANLSGCRTYSVAEFHDAHQHELFDAIHLGDVLEHLPDPRAALLSLVDGLPSGGIIFVEGPLEVNPSPVYWSTVAFGLLKKWIRRGVAGAHPPTHLFRTDAASQHEFFLRLGSSVQIVDWKIEETGWPYSEGGLIKRAIAALAKTIGGTRIFGVMLGNRFKGILIKVEAAGTGNNKIDGAEAGSP